VRGREEESGVERTADTNVARVKAACLGLLVPARLGVLGDGERLASQESLIGLELRV